MDAITYKKRQGTSGISGHLYETKLISLILFRLLHDKDVKQFYLASNVDDIGAFDDICFKVEITGQEKPILVYIQAKHKENEETFLNFDLIKNFHESYVKVKQKFDLCKNQKHDVFYKSNFDAVECVFVLYTNAKWFGVANNTHNSSPRPPLKETRKLCVSEFANKLNSLIATGDEIKQGAHVDYTKEDLELASKVILEEEITTLAEHFAKFLSDNPNKSMNIMLDEYMSRYHVILAQNVVNVSEVFFDGKKPDLKWRIMTFRSDFFDKHDKILSMLRNKLCLLIVKNQDKKKNSKIDIGTTKHNESIGSDVSSVEQQISQFLSEPSAISLSPLLGSHVIYKKGVLKFTADRPSSDLERLDQINIPPLIVEQAETIAATNMLLSLKVKVPVFFGNIDLNIREGSYLKKRLDFLANTFISLCEGSKLIDKYKIVTIDKTIGDGFLNNNGGIGSAVGNLLVYDKATKLLKFTEDYTQLNNNSKALFDKLCSKINNLDVYRFDVKAIIKLPKLVFDYTKEAEAILDKMIIFEKQSGHIRVEEIVKQEIEIIGRINDPHGIPVKTDTIAVYYHNEVQKWWMSPTTNSYFTKSSDIYKQALNNILVEPQISAMHSTFYMHNIKYFEYSFKECATAHLNSLQFNLHMIISTDLTTLQAVKVIQYIKHKYDNKYTVLDLEYMLNLPTNDFTTLNIEIEKTDKVLIIVCGKDCDNIKRRRLLHKRLEDLAQATMYKTIIVISNKTFLDIAQEYFPQAIFYEDEQSLRDMTVQAQKNLMKEVTVIFQDQEISLDYLMDGVSGNIIKGAVLNKVIRKKIIIVGESLSNPGYEKIKHLCIDRRVREPSGTVKLVKTFNDIDKRVVLLTAKPGMGKSTLLTHLSLNTKELDNKLWIVRINLLDHTEEIANWPNDIIKINHFVLLQFLYRVVLKNNKLSLCVNVNDTKEDVPSPLGDEWEIFVYNIFLHFYNEGKVILLFDGFDEVCPDYKGKVIRLFNIIKNNGRNTRMWVTSRPYIEILPHLERALGKAYEIEYINNEEQEDYLNRIWREKILFSDLTKNQLDNIITFIHFVPEQIQSKNKDMSGFRIIYKLFYKYLHDHFPYIGTEPLPSDDVGESSSETDGRKKIAAVNELTGTPLILYLVADYFIHVIDQNTYKLPKNINILTIYKTFVEKQLKIYSQEKSKMDIYNPVNMRKYEQDRTKCIDIHKKLAACAVFRSIILDDSGFVEFREMRPFTEDTLFEYEAMIREIKSGTEKTGLISHVTPADGPVFIHQTFAEYFAAEYISDIFKSHKFDQVTKDFLHLVIYFYAQEIIVWLKMKAEYDRELDHIIQSEVVSHVDLKEIYIKKRFSLCLLEHCRHIFSLEQHVKIFHSKLDDYEPDSFDEFLEYMIYVISKSEPDKKKYINVMINKIVSKMKPHLQQSFTSFLK